MLSRLFFAAALALIVGAPAGAQPASQAQPIRAFDLRTLEQLGQAIHRQDVTAAKATDALLKVVPDPGRAGIIGWVVTERSSGDVVRFVRRAERGIAPAYEVEVPQRGSPVVKPVSGDGVLTADERARFAAERRRRAASSAPVGGATTLWCFETPSKTGGWFGSWRPSPAAGAVPVGGHVRFSISADGSTVKRRDELSTSCLVIDPRQGVPAGAQPVGVVASHVVSPTPVETHVFLRLLYRMPVYVQAGGRLWKVSDGRIEPQR
jgi:hypothetical protein